MLNQLEADLDILINEVMDGEGFMARRALQSRQDKIKAIARRILGPVYDDAAKYRKIQRETAQEQRIRHLGYER